MGLAFKTACLVHYNHLNLCGQAENKKMVLDVGIKDKLPSSSLSTLKSFNSGLSVTISETIQMF